MDIYLCYFGLHTHRLRNFFFSGWFLLSVFSFLHKNFHTNGHPHIHERDVLMPLSMYSFLCLLRLPARRLGVSSHLVLISLILRGGGDLFQIHLAIVLKVNA